jgi:16S rRNA (guanine966-N2)-methyltransferase
MLRITGGEFRNRRLAVPKGEDVIRPATDRIRQAIFNILGAKGIPRENCVVLDVFCGTGAIALEALSRGADTAIFIDAGAEALALTEANIKALKLESRCHIVRRTMPKIGVKPSNILAADLVFVDPPYRKDLVASTLAALAEGGWIASGAMIVIETAEDETFDSPAAFTLSDRRSYGGTALSFLIFSESVLDDTSR